jgi:hypothetical protein
MFSPERLTTASMWLLSSVSGKSTKPVIGSHLTNFMTFVQFRSFCCNDGLLVGGNDDLTSRIILCPPLVRNGISAEPINPE